jgi:quercetin dioxygenase-like cupin family protein
MAETLAEMLLPSKELREDIEFYTSVLGMRLDEIFPADDPRTAVISGHGLRVRLQTGSNQEPGTIRILTDDPRSFADGKTELFAPNGTRVEIAERDPPLVLPEPELRLVVHRAADDGQWVVGRAGMRYRDLVPKRLGGAIIGSHLRIDGGEVDEAVHYHIVGFQLVYCLNGWLEVVYEDQGPPFRVQAGDAVTQPPGIRHRTLEASPDAEIVEVALPAEHVTIMDRDMSLPNRSDPDRLFQGQRFLFATGDGSDWSSHRLVGFCSRDLGAGGGTSGAVRARLVRRGNGDPEMSEHRSGIIFTFVAEGGLTLEVEGAVPQRLGKGDAFVIPPGTASRYEDPTDDVALLEVALPADPSTSGAEAC